METRHSGGTLKPKPEKGGKWSNLFLPWRRCHLRCLCQHRRPFDSLHTCAQTLLHDDGRRCRAIAPPSGSWHHRAFALPGGGPPPPTFARRSDDGRLHLLVKNSKSMWYKTSPCTGTHPPPLPLPEGANWPCTLHARVLALQLWWPLDITAHARGDRGEDGVWGEEEARVWERRRRSVWGGTQVTYIRTRGSSKSSCLYN